MAKSRRRPYKTATAMALGGLEKKWATARVRLRWLRGAAVLLVVLVVAGGLWLTLDDRFYIYRADVLGANRVSRESVFAASELPGLHVLWVDPAEIESRILSALPSLKSAQVACRLPAKCTITVVERQPKVVWEEAGDQRSEKRVWWIDADGVLFPAQGAFTEGWEVQGPLPRDESDELDERVRIALIELLVAEASVSELFYYTPGRGLAYMDARGRRIVLGEGPGMAERLQVLQWLMDDLEARGLTPRVVDVRFPEAPYYSLTNTW